MSKIKFLKLSNTVINLDHVMQIARTKLYKQEVIEVMFVGADSDGTNVTSFGQDTPEYKELDYFLFNGGLYDVINDLEERVLDLTEIRESYSAIEEIKAEPVVEDDQVSTGVTIRIPAYSEKLELTEDELKHIQQMRLNRLQQVFEGTNINVAILSNPTEA